MSLNFLSIVTGKFRREFHRSYFKCFCCCLPSPTTDQNGTSFAPIGSSRAGTTRTIVRRNDSCVSYRLTHLSPSNHNSINRDFVRNTNTSFIEQLNGNRRPKVRDDSISESATRFTLTSDAGRDWQLGKDFLVCYNDLRKDGIESYIARSTNSIDCKPYYDCFKGAGPSGVCQYSKKCDKILDERHSDTYADYREEDSKELFMLNEDGKNGFKFKFNRSLNSCQIKNKRKINTVY